MAHLLIVDDDANTLASLARAFRLAGHEATVCDNAARALDLLKSAPFDMMLSDVVMPEKNGYEVCEAIKSNPATSRVPVVLLSGTFEPFDRDRAERLGCDAIVSKPFDSQQLLRQVEALLARPQAEVSPAHTMAIPVMTNPTPPPAPAEEPADPGDRVVSVRGIAEG